MIPMAAFKCRAAPASSLEGAEIDPMQNTYPPRQPRNPQKFATPTQPDFLCRNHSTSVYPTSGAYRRRVRNTDSFLPALINRYTRTNSLPTLRAGDHTSGRPANDVSLPDPFHLLLWYPPVHRGVDD